MLVAADHSFCPRCGAAQGETDLPLETSELPCPGCRHTLAIWPLDPRLAGPSGYRGNDPQIHACQHCGGAWVDRRTLDRIIAEARTHASSVDPAAVPRQTMAFEESFVYRSCPRCSQQMHRRNFGRYSGVVVDECSTCGTYFDAGELPGVIAFVRGGGLTLAEQRDADETRRDIQHRRRMSSPPALGGGPHSMSLGHSGSLLSSWLNGAELALVVGLLRWLGRWLRYLRRLGG